MQKMFFLLIFSVVILSTNAQSKSTTADSVKTIKSKPDTTVKSTEEETVEIGYGTILKSRQTESISSIKVEDIRMTINATIGQAIQGRAAGVYVTSSGEPGGRYSSVNIRGISSAFGSNQPLVVVNGMPTTSDILNMLNPNDIERIDILKDAASCAIYGSRGANGVIIITLK